MKYFLDCFKVDNEKYHEQVTKNDMIIDSDNDDIGACQKMLIIINNLSSFVKVHFMFMIIYGFVENKCL
jgi:hypothetical protein